MRSPTVVTGVVLFAVASLLALVPPSLIGPTDDAGPPAVVFVSGVVLAVLTLVALGVWASGTRAGHGTPRIAMRAAVIFRVLAALIAVPGLIVSNVPVEGRVVSAIFIVFTIVGVVLVRRELGRSRSLPGSDARASHPASR